MAETDAEKLTKDTIKNGGVLAILYFDIHAKTKESLQELGTGFINSIIQRPKVVFAYGEIDEPVDGGEGKNWSSSISVKVLTKDFAALGALCMAHSPFTVEILRPDEIKLQLAEAHELLGNMSAATTIVALDEARRQGRVRKGDLVELIAFGAGLTWGASVIQF